MCLTAKTVTTIYVNNVQLQWTQNKPTMLTWTCLQRVYITLELWYFLPQFRLDVSFYQWEWKAHLSWKHIHTAAMTAHNNAVNRMKQWCHTAATTTHNNAVDRMKQWCHDVSNVNLSDEFWLFNCQLYSAITRSLSTHPTRSCDSRSFTSYTISNAQTTASKVSQKVIQGRVKYR